VRADNLYVDVNFACFLTGGQLAPLRFTCALAPLAHTGAVLGLRHDQPQKYSRFL
jgi:hypothetical protein